MPFAILAFRVVASTCSMRLRFPVSGSLAGAERDGFLCGGVAATLFPLGVVVSTLGGGGGAFGSLGVSAFFKGAEDSASEAAALNVTGGGLTGELNGAAGS